MLFKFKKQGNGIFIQKIDCYGNVVKIDTEFIDKITHDLNNFDNYYKEVQILNEMLAEKKIIIRDLKANIDKMTQTASDYEYQKEANQSLRDQYLEAHQSYDNLIKKIETIFSKYALIELEEFNTALLGLHKNSEPKLLIGKTPEDTFNKTLKNQISNLIHIRKKLINQRHKNNSFEKLELED